MVLAMEGGLLHSQLSYQQKVPHGCFRCVQFRRRPFNYFGFDSFSSRLFLLDHHNAVHRRHFFWQHPFHICQKCLHIASEACYIASEACYIDFQDSETSLEPVSVDPRTIWEL